MNFDQHKNKHDIKEVQEQIDELEKDIDEIKQRLQNDQTDKSFTGIAFVIFEKQSEAEQLIWKFKRTWIRKVFNFIVLKVSISSFNK